MVGSIPGVNNSSMGVQNVGVVGHNVGVADASAYSQQIVVGVAAQGVQSSLNAAIQVSTVQDQPARAIQPTVAVQVGGV